MSATSPHARLAEGVGCGQGEPLLLIAGPCVVESRELCFEVAGRLVELCGRLGVGYVFKASYDKANRTSLRSFRGPGLEAGLQVLADLRAALSVPVLTDVHEPAHAAQVAAAVDVLQIPAFLCRQTDLLLAAAATGRPVNVKKGQFMAPSDMRHVVEKLRIGGATQVLLTERGTSFGYGDLVVDFRALPQLRALGVPVVFDATHAVQQPGAGGAVSGGQREHVAPLARAAVAVGVDALFMEVHPAPAEARSDGPNMVRLERMEALLEQLLELRFALERRGPVSSGP